MKTVAIAAALVMLAGTAKAQETPWSFGLAFASAQEDFDTGGLSWDDGTALALRAGYRLNSALTFEGELEYLDGFDGDATIGLTTVEAEVEAWVLSARAKYFPLSKILSRAIQPYLLGGVGVARSKFDFKVSGAGSGSSRDTDALWMGGLGFDYWVTKKWAVGAEWVYKDVEGSGGYSTIGLNAQYRF